MYGGTVLGQAVWSAIHDPKVGHPEIMRRLVAARANVEAAGYPTGDERIIELLRPRRAD